MSFVVRITVPSGDLAGWIGHHTRLGPRRIVDRDEARVFPTESEADHEIDIWRDLMPGDVRFETEDA